MVRFLLVLLVALVVIYLTFCAFVFLFQRKLIYLPSKNLEYFSLLNHIGLKEIWLKSGREKINAWYKWPAENRQPVILFLHGNGGNLTHRIEKFETLIRSGYGLLAIDYRGYGKSSGKPTEEGLYKDGAAALNYLNASGYKDRDIMVYGESLGSGVAVELAKNNKFKAVILEAPFTSLVDLGKMFYPMLPVRLLLYDRFNSYQKIDKLQSPLFIFHGEDDITVPAEQSLELFKKSDLIKKYRKVFPGKGHLDLDLAAIIGLVEENI